MPSPNDSAMDFKFTLDPTGVVDGSGKMVYALKQVEDTAGLAGKALDKFGKIAVGAAGIITAVLKAPVDLDNYLGQLNQKITQVGGSLENYRKIYTEFLDPKTFKHGEGAFGLAEEDYQRIMKQFATGTTALEKYGSASKANVTDFTQGSGMLMKTLGLEPAQAAADRKSVV